MTEFINIVSKMMNYSKLRQVSETDTAQPTIFLHYKQWYKNI